MIFQYHGSRLSSIYSQSGPQNAGDPQEGAGRQLRSSVERAERASRRATKASATLATIGPLPSRHGEAVAISDKLDVEVSSDQEKYILNPKVEHFTAREMAIAATCNGAKKKLPQRKHDCLGFVKSHCGSINSEDKIQELTKRSELACSLATINKRKGDEKKKKAADRIRNAEALAPAAAVKLQSINNGNYDKLTVPEMKSILHVYYGKDQVKGKKAEIMAQLKRAYEDNPQAVSGTTALSHATNNNDANDDSTGGDDNMA